MSELAFISRERKFSTVKGTGVQYIPGHEESFVDYVISNYVNDKEQILELGGGGMRFAIPAADKNKNITVVDSDKSSLDIKAIIQKVKSNEKVFVDEELVSSRINVVEGDVSSFLETSSKLYDLIVSFRVIHFFTPEKLRKFFELCSSSLAEDGTFVVSAITPYSNGNKDLTNEIFDNTAPVDQSIYFREFVNSNEAQNIREAQNLSSRMHFVDESLVSQLCKEFGLELLESDISSTRVVAGYIIRKA